MWGPVNGEIAVQGWPRSHLKRARKAVDTKTWPDRLTHALICCLFVSFSCSDFPLSSSPLPHCFSLSLLFPLLPLPLPCPFPCLLFSGGALLDRAGFQAMYCCVDSLPSAQRPGILAWHWHTGWGPGLCSLCSGQLAEQLKVKHLGL